MGRPGGGLEVPTDVATCEVGTLAPQAPGPVHCGRGATSGVSGPSGALEVTCAMASQGSSGRRPVASVSRSIWGLGPRFRFNRPAGTENWGGGVNTGTGLPAYYQLSLWDREGEHRRRSRMCARSLWDRKGESRREVHQRDLVAIPVPKGHDLST